MLLILIQYLYYSFLSQFIHMSHTSSHHGLECPCLLIFFLQMSKTSRISTQNTHERLFSNDIHIKLAWTMNMWMIYRVFFVCNLSYNVISIMNIISTFSQMLMYKSSNHHSKSQWLLTAMKRKIYNTITHIQTM